MAGLRIILGLALLFDVLTYLPDRQEMFGAGGVLGLGGSQRPILTWLNHLGISTEVLAPSSIALDLIFAVFICAILFFILGYAYRVAAVVVWIILNYFMLRNYLVFNAGHSLASNFLFFLMFIPADKVASVSAYIKNRSLKGLWKERVIENAWAVRAIQLQISILYFSTFIFKLIGEYWREGTAVYYATRIPPHSSTQFEFLLSSGFLINLATYGTLLVEGGLALMIWIPRFRYWSVMLAICFHLLLEVSLETNIFQWIMIAGLLSFFEGKDSK
jgi:hypothetical protein